jgi:hypothetical protein
LVSCSGGGLNLYQQALEKRSRPLNTYVPQEQAAIDRLLAVARELASDTGTAGKYLNANRNHPQSFEYQNQ